jgi:general secretion pathway protein E/type IV pilus assembly protein PilB
MLFKDFLLQRSLVAPDKLDAALARAASTGERLEQAITATGAMPRQAVLTALGQHLRMPVVDLSTITVDADILAALPSRVVYRGRCVPVSRANGRLTIATSDPFDSALFDELRISSGCAIDLALADEDELTNFIKINYGVGGDTLDALAADGQGTPSAEVAPGDDAEAAQEASVVKLVNDILTEAVNDRATDVHIEPYEKELIVRYRIDGVLHRANVAATINRFSSAIVSRLKIMANLNIAEKRLPQDGRITFKTRTPGKPPVEFDLRVSIIPMLFGEGVVLRVLNKSAVLMPLTELGMPESVLSRWGKLIDRPHGILLVTGPTGSGKSTTLYASLNRIVSDEIKAITVEDPVEYHVPGVNQIQTNAKIGLDFAAGLRSILRHDPDVVMIGEIRDKETAEVAVQASLTGHLVFSTLHTNDSAGATTRLLDMGVEPFLVASSVEGILAQRLVRRLCKECGTMHIPDPAEVPEDFPLAPTEQIPQSVGCRACRNTGFKGRIGVYELLTLDPETRDLLMHRASSQVIATRALAQGNLQTLRQDGFAKVRAGHTTLAELIRGMAG